MTWVDAAVVSAVMISALVAYGRGFVREALTIMTWAGAGWASYGGIDWVRGPMREMMGQSEIVDVAAHGALFLITLLVLSIVSGVVSDTLQRSGMGALDRTLGLAFGLARGGLMLVVLYVGAGWVSNPERWPESVRGARTLPLVADAARWTADKLPDRFRPSVPLPPPLPITRALDLMQATPLGRPAPRP